MLQEHDISHLEEFLPFWNTLEPANRQSVIHNTRSQTYCAGAVIHTCKKSCIGVLVIVSGRLRIYIVGEDGKEITLFRLTDGDTCVFSASCVLRNITFDVHIQSEVDTTVLSIPPNVYKELERSDMQVQDFTNQIVTSRFSDVMWVMEQVVFMSMHKRLAIYLTEQMSMVGTETLRLTHDAIAKDLGTAREVVTRLLKYFQEEGLVSLSRGVIHILDSKAVSELGNI